MMMMMTMMMSWNGTTKRGKRRLGWLDMCYRQTASSYHTKHYKGTRGELVDQDKLKHNQERHGDTKMPRRHHLPRTTGSIP